MADSAFPLRYVELQPMELKSVSFGECVYKCKICVSLLKLRATLNMVHRKYQTNDDNCSIRFEAVIMLQCTFMNSS